MSKRILSVLMAILLCFGCFGLLGGCDKEENNSQTVVLLNGFEDFERDMQLIKLLNGFGQVNVNEDPQYIKSGSKSAELRPKGYNYAKVPPYIVLPTMSTRFGFDYCDFTKVNSVSLWVYNAEDEVIEIAVGLLAGPVKSSQWYSSSTNVPGEYFQLQTGWNRLTYDIVPAYLETNSHFSTGAVYGVYIECPYTDCFLIKDTPRLYVDDVKLHMGTPNATPLTFDADIEKGVWEIADFESSYEGSMFYVYRTGSTNPVYAVPTSKVVQESKHRTDSTNGTGVLEITLRAGTGDYGWPAITLDGNALKAAFAAVGQDLIAHPENYEFKFDMYNCQDFVKSGCTLFMYGKDGENVTGWGRGVSADYESWTTFSVNIGYLNGNDKDGDYVTNPGNVNFLFGQFADAENTDDRFLLFDNFRIEKVA